MTPEWSQSDSQTLSTWRYPSDIAAPAVALTIPIEEMSWIQRTATEQKLKELLAQFGHTSF